MPPVRRVFVLSGPSWIVDVPADLEVGQRPARALEPDLAALRRPRALLGRDEVHRLGREVGDRRQLDLERLVRAGHHPRRGAPSPLRLGHVGHPPDRVDEPLVERDGREQARGARLGRCVALAQVLPRAGRSRPRSSRPRPRRPRSTGRRARCGPGAPPGRARPFATGPSRGRAPARGSPGSEAARQTPGPAPSLAANARAGGGPAGGPPARVPCRLG